jgi:peptidoglycan/LPS O-acetylase OafA/YrhL
MPDPADCSTPALRRRYMREFIPAMTGYVVTLMASVWLLKQVQDPALRAAIALAPVPFVALVLRAVVRHIRDTDELQRRIEVEAVSIATALVSLGYFAAGLLQSAKVVDVPSSAAMIWVLPLVCLVYGLAKAVIARRYA